MCVEMEDQKSYGKEKGKELCLWHFVLHGGNRRRLCSQTSPRGAQVGGGRFIPHRNETSKVVTMDIGEETCI